MYSTLVTPVLILTTDDGKVIAFSDVEKAVEDNFGVQPGPLVDMAASQARKVSVESANASIESPKKFADTTDAGLESDVGKEAGGVTKVSHAGEQVGVDSGYASSEVDSEVLETPGEGEAEGEMVADAESSISSTTPISAPTLFIQTLTNDHFHLRNLSLTLDLPSDAKGADTARKIGPFETCGRIIDNGIEQYMDIVVGPVEAQYSEHCVGWLKSQRLKKWRGYKLEAVHFFNAVLAMMLLIAVGWYLGCSAMVHHLQT